MVGKVLAQYQIVEKLGEGGMGVVWKARDTHLDRFVALKTLAADRLADAERKRRFVQEAKAASALNHPNIVHIYDIADADGVQFIAMEYVAGKTLDQLIGRKGLRPGEVLKYAVQIADALAKAHSAGIVHRDLKPSNIMVTGSGLVKVLDFGLAKLAETATGEQVETATMRAKEGPNTEEGVIVGTAAYMSPEQAEGKQVDARSDIFSFGSVLYEMVTGKRAFHGDSKLSTLSAILKDDPKPVSGIVTDVPRDLEKIISHCLRKDPERRFQHMDDLKLALLDLKEESDSGKLPAIAHVGIGARSRKSRLAWGAAVVSLFVIALGAVALWFSRTEPTRKAGTRVVPVTNYPGAEMMPTFSPDGRQIAFCWNGENRDHSYDLYVKLLDAGEPVRLTTQGAWWPAWSPDGRFIAFERQLHASERSAVFVVPALRGAERKLAEVYLPVEVPTPHPAWTPDSKWLVLPDRPSPSAPFGLVLLSVESGERRPLTRPPAYYQADGSPAVSPDGKTLAFARSPAISGMASLWLLALSEDFAPRGEPKQLTSEESQVGDLMWAADGREVLYVTSSGVNRILQRVAVSGARSTRRDMTITLGPNAFGAALSTRGDRLVYSVLSGFKADVCRLELAGVKQDSRPLITSSFSQGNARISPDGRRIVFASDRSGSFQIWVCDSDGSNAVQLTSLGTALTGSPHWSPDGREIAFDSTARGKADIYVMDAGGGKPRRLTDDPAAHVVPTWSRDGRWIYFASNRTGGYQVWKMPVVGGQARQVTTKGSAGGLESSDGKWLYFARTWGPDTSIWKVSANGGEETAVVDHLLNVHNFDVVHDGIYFVQSGNGPSSVRFYRFATGRVELVAPLKTFPWLGLSVSPDRRWMLVTQQTIPEGGDLMMIENFR